MPVSVGRHNLARIRMQLQLTQADVAQLAGCSSGTIKSVEIGKLGLSDSLASRISEALRIDKEWLLKNDLDAPLPSPIPWSLPVANLAAGKDYAPSDNATYGEAMPEVVKELFSRLFAVVAKSERSLERTLMEAFLANELDALKKAKEPTSDYRPRSIANSDAIRYFIQYPDHFDPDLREWVDLKGLLKSNPRLFLQSHGRHVFHSIPTLEPKGEAPSRKRRKLPNQNPESPSPAGRHKTRASS
jgi:transcriptional regulator with XRE-family HTH domain